MITLQFSRSGKIGSRLIRWFTWSDWSHVDIVLPDGRLLGATGARGVAIRDYDQSVSHVRFTVDAPDVVIDLAMTQLGKKYDYAAIIGMPFRRDWQDGRKWFCSELVAWAFAEAGHPLLRMKRNGRVTPGDLLKSPFLLE